MGKDIYLKNNKPTPAPTPAMVAYIKTICGEFGLELPNLRCFVSSKNFLDSDAPVEILKIQKTLKEFSKEILPELESSGVDDLDRKKEVLSKILIKNGDNIGPKTIEKIINKGIPDLRKYGEGLFDDVGQKLLDNIEHKGFKKKSKSEDVDVVNDDGLKEKVFRADSRPSQMPKNNFDKNEMAKSIQQRDFTGYIERRVVDGYLSLIPRVHMVDYKDFYKTSDSFDELKNSIKNNESIDAVANKAKGFCDNVLNNFNDKTIDEKTCKSYKKILHSTALNLRESGVFKNAEQKIKKIEEILSELVKFISMILSKLVSSVGLSRG